MRLLRAGSILRPVRDLFSSSPEWTAIPQHNGDSEPKHPLYRPNYRRRNIFIAFSAFVGLVLIVAMFRSQKVRSLMPRRYVIENAGSNPFFYPPIGDEHFPAVASYNEPPLIRPKTPLFIAFTRNNDMLVQTVASFIAAGWPRSDIIVVDNSGTMDANPQNLLSNDNPFFLDYETLLKRYGVSILRTPTLLTFAQLQNFYIANALANKWKHYYWAHSDIAAVTDETVEPYKSFYQRIIDDLNLMRNNHKADPSKWAIRWYRYDWLTLVNVDAMKIVGGWDTFIPYYITDCEFNDRVTLNGLNISETRVGRVFDLARQAPNMEELFFPGPDEESTPNQPRYKRLIKTMEDLMHEKYSNKKKNGRNSWQTEQKGGKGEPWTYDPEGFSKAWWLWSDYGKKVYEKKWGMSGCGLVGKGRKIGQEWSFDT